MIPWVSYRASEAAVDMRNLTAWILIYRSNTENDPQGRGVSKPKLIFSPIQLETINKWNKPG